MKSLTSTWMPRVTLMVMAWFAHALILQADQLPSNPNATPQTKATLNWLSNLRTRSENKVVIGQYVTRNLNNTDNRTAEQSWQYYYKELHRITGKQVGLAGFDFSTRRKSQQRGSDNTPGDDRWRSYAIEHAAEGGLLKIMWHAGNPWSDASSWSEIPTGHSLADLITPGNPAHTTWMAWLSAAADALHAYQSDGITVMWAPLHEANGDWFWWCTGAGSSHHDYVEVWRHMYDYFTTTRGLHNILWAYCPDNNAPLNAAIARYPGNGYVDIISPDKYDNVKAELYTEFTKPAYGKVFGWGEVGHNGPLLDNRMYIDQIKSSFPLVAFYMQWADNSFLKSIRSNLQADEVMDVDWIITRDELAREAEL